MFQLKVSTCRSIKIENKETWKIYGFYLLLNIPQDGENFVVVLLISSAMKF